MSITQIELNRKQWESILDHVKSCVTEETCGFLGGIGTKVYDVIPVSNVYHSPIRFRMDPEEQLEAMLQIENLGHEIIAIYHSHIQGLLGLSEIDLAEAAYPDVAHMVCAKDGERWQCRAYCIAEGRVTEIPVLIQED